MHIVFIPLYFVVLLYSLNVSTLQPDSSIPTVWDTFRSHMGMRDLFSLQLCPPTDVLVIGASVLQGGWMVTALSVLLE